MKEYFSYKGLLLDRYEWSSGMGANHKVVVRAQSGRRKELKNKLAKIIEESEWL